MTNSTFPIAKTDVVQSIINSLKNGILTNQHAEEIAEALDLTPAQGHWMWESNPTASGFLATKVITSILGSRMALTCKLSLEDEVLGWNVEI